jgi:hypothetical protein
MTYKEAQVYAARRAADGWCLPPFWNFIHSINRKTCRVTIWLQTGFGPSPRFQAIRVFKYDSSIGDALVQVETELHRSFGKKLLAYPSVLSAKLHNQLVN